MQNMCYPIGDIVDLTEHHVKYSDVLRYSTFYLTIIACIVGLSGNAIVIFFNVFVIKKNKSKVWFLNLAINDFVSVLLMPLQAFALLGNNWTYGPHLCKIYLFVMFLNMYASIFILIALNISRVLSVAKPMFYQKFISQRASCWTCTFTWMITLLFTLPVLIFGREFKIGENTYCTFMISEDFVKEPSQPAYNLTAEDLKLEEKVYLDAYQKNGHFFKECSSEKCCCSEDTIEKWDHLIYSVKCFDIPFIIIAYFLPLCVIIFSNITIAIQVQKSQTVKPHRLYRIVITAIVVYFVTCTPAVLGNMIYMAAVMNRNLIMMSKVMLFMPFLCSIAYTNNSLNPIVYVLLGTKVRTSFSNMSEGLRRIQNQIFKR